jgi:hypothetical protein
MKLSEFNSSQLRAYGVLVRLRNGVTIKTIVFAQAHAWARALATQMYGDNSIVSIMEDINELMKSPSSEQLRIRSLDDQAKRYRDLAKQAKAQERVKKANKALAKANKR